NDTLTVITTDTATPLTTVGVNSHWRTAATAAASSCGIDRRTTALATWPSGPIVASRTTTPCTRSRCASGGYTGLTSLIFRGAGMLPPTRMGGGPGGTGGANGAARTSTVTFTCIASVVPLAFTTVASYANSSLPTYPSSAE